MKLSSNEIRHQFEQFSNELLRKRNARGYWEGRLSSSALGVAVAVTALHFYNEKENDDEIANGLRWLEANINDDGGFGDSPSSRSNVSTTLLCYAAVKACSKDDCSHSMIQKIGVYLSTQNIDVNSEKLIPIILDYYKTDRTFSVPILTMCALCGVPGHEAFEVIPQLPFELSLMPRSLYRMLNLSVVSYAIPALIAVGIAIFKFKRRKNPLMRLLRESSIRKSLLLLRKIQPQSGGYLEAIPLTAFVSLCLIESGFRDLEVVRDGIAFLKSTQRGDGSWPIDVDLSTWVSTLAVKSFRNKLDEVFHAEEKAVISSHLLSIQNKTVHPFNGTQPGGWGWTSHSGSVPDGDDTPGTILALLALNAKDPLPVRDVVLAGCYWLFDLQNSDGGFPTFSKGWGKLPFDQSCADLTGHALLALARVEDVYLAGMSKNQHSRFRKSFVKALLYLKRHQETSGYWLPLWFGNQHTTGHINPVYGTARVLSYLNATLSTLPGKEYEILLKLMIGQGCQYLVSVQNPDGSWGGGRGINGSIEETALAITALTVNGFNKECALGHQWLKDTMASKGMVASPIGLYFASLWYDEALYPLTAVVECLSATMESKNADLEG